MLRLPRHDFHDSAALRCPGPRPADLQVASKVAVCTLAPILAKAFGLLAEDGCPVTAEDIRRDITRLFRGNFQPSPILRAAGSMASGSVTGSARPGMFSTIFAGRSAAAFFATTVNYIDRQAWNP